MKKIMQKDAIETETETFEKKIYWSGILAGTIVALIISALLSLLGIGLGFITFSAADTTVSKITISTGIWFILSGIISMYCGGWMAGYFNQEAEARGCISGFLTYCLTTFIGFLTMTTALAIFMNSAFNILGQSLLAASSAASSAVTTISSVAPAAGKMAEEIVPDLKPAYDKIKDQIKELMRRSQITQTIQQMSTSEEIQSKIENAFKNYIEAINTDNQNEMRSKLTQALIESTGISTPEAEQNVENWQNMFNEMKEKITAKANEAKEQAKQMAEKAVNAMGVIALTNFAILLLGAIAAMLGGIQGVKSNRVKFY